MNYTTSKIFIIVFCSIFMLIGGGAIVSALLAGGNLFILVWGAMFFFIPLTIMRGRLKQLSTFEKMTTTGTSQNIPSMFKEIRSRAFPAAMHASMFVHL